MNTRTSSNTQQTPFTKQMLICAGLAILGVAAAVVASVGDAIATALTTATIVFNWVTLRKAWMPGHKMANNYYHAIVEAAGNYLWAFLLIFWGTVLLIAVSMGYGALFGAAFTAYIASEFINFDQAKPIK